LLVTGEFVPPTADGRMRRLMRTYPVPAGTPETTRGILTNPPGAGGSFAVDPTGDWILSIFDGSIFESSLRQLDRAPRLVARGGDDPISAFILGADGTRIYAIRKSGGLRVVSRATGVQLSMRDGVPVDSLAVAIGHDDRFAAVALGSQQVHVHDLNAPPEVEAGVVRVGGRPLGVALEPGGSWMAVQDNRTLSLWPLSWRHPQVLRQDAKLVHSLAIDPGSRWIASGGVGSTKVSLWSLREGTVTGRTILDMSVSPIEIEASPRGDLLAVGTMTGLWIRPLDGRAERLPGFNSMVNAIAIDRSGRWLAAGGGMLGQLAAPGENIVRVWDLETRAVRVLAAADGAPIGSLAFLPDGRLLATGPAGVRMWDLGSDTSTLLLPDIVATALPSPDGRRLLLLRAPLRPGGAVGGAVVYDFESKQSTPLLAHGNQVTSVDWHPSGQQVVTGSQDGVVRVGPADGSEPHLLLGHEAIVWQVRVDPRGRWLASAADDGTMRVWPMPEGAPFHTLPQAALIDRLRSLTTYRVVEDGSTSSGYRLDFEPFTGWKRPSPQW